jgi:phospho-N-acetylmuramoyl-pentapeptide-transferase
LGDTGALGIGASLGYFALVCKQEIPYAIASMVLILEALSVIFQRLYFKATGGKRLFKMAPLHHHFELLGWPESKIIIRFWIVSILCAALAFATLKIR